MYKRILETSKGEIIVAIGPPEFDGEDFVCKFRIEGPEHDKCTGEVFGVDEIQAFQLCISRLKSELERLESKLTCMLREFRFDF